MTRFLPGVGADGVCLNQLCVFAALSAAGVYRSTSCGQDLIDHAKSARTQRLKKAQGAERGTQSIGCAHAPIQLCLLCGFAGLGEAGLYRSTSCGQDLIDHAKSARTQRLKKVQGAEGGTQSIGCAHAPFHHCFLCVFAGLSVAGLGEFRIGLLV